MPGGSKSRGPAKKRLDKYWVLAHQEGYRARSAYKLTQLNKKFSLLTKATTVVDLCAAPGGWMQVCQQLMPVTAKIIGVDLFPIKPIPGCKSIIGDITTEKTRREIIRELGGKKCEVVIHDGAPPVGGTWDKDAYVQNVLVLAAARLACQILQKDGTFLSKVFRSIDYTRILYVLNQLFDRVESTKPPSSRDTSAEIFVICRGFKAPKMIDPAMFNPKDVFREIDEKTVDEGGIDVEKGIFPYAKPIEMSAHQFIFKSKNPDVILANFSKITFDSPEDQSLLKSRHTNEDVLAACEDLRVLGRYEVKRLMRWRQCVWVEERRNKEAARKEEEELDYSGDEEGGEDFEPVTRDEDADLADIQKKIKKIKAEEDKEAKKRAKKRIKAKIKTAKATNFDPMDNPMSAMANQVGDMFASERADRVNIDFRNSELGMDQESKGDTLDVDMGGRESNSDDDASSDDVSDDGAEELFDADPTRPEEVDGPAKGGDSEADYFTRMSQALESDHSRRRAAQLGHLEKPEQDSNRGDQGKVINMSDEEGSDDSGPLEGAGDGAVSDIDSDYESGSDESASDEGPPRKKARRLEGDEAKHTKRLGFEEVPKMMRDPESRGKALAIGLQMKTSAKAKRDIMEAGCNRYAHNDTENLPDWFLDDEKKHCFVPLPSTTKEEAALQKARTQEINKRPSMKVVEALHRKRQKAKRIVSKLEDKAKNEGGAQHGKTAPSVRQVMRSKRMDGGGKKNPKRGNRGPKQKLDTRSKGEQRRVWEQNKKKANGGRKRKR